MIKKPGTEKFNDSLSNMRRKRYKNNNQIKMKTSYKFF